MQIAAAEHKAWHHKDVLAAASAYFKFLNDPYGDYPPTEGEEE